MRDGVIEGRCNTPVLSKVVVVVRDICLVHPSNPRVLPSPRWAKLKMRSNIATPLKIMALFGVTL